MGFVTFTAVPLLGECLAYSMHLRSTCHSDCNYPEIVTTGDMLK